MLEALPIPRSEARDRLGTAAAPTIAALEALGFTDATGIATYVTLSDFEA